MDILGQTAQEHYVDYNSKTFKKLIFSKKKKNKPTHGISRKLKHWHSKLVQIREGSRFRQIPKL